MCDGAEAQERRQETSSLLKIGTPKTPLNISTQKSRDFCVDIFRLQCHKGLKI